MTTPQPVEPEYTPSVFRYQGSLYLNTGSELPKEICICSGKPAHKSIRKALRNPFNPLTWFGGQERIEFGLCKKHAENYQVALALTFSLLAIGVIILAISAYTGSIGGIAFGLLAILGCGFFRARVPVWSPDTKAEPMELRGVGEPFMAQFPELPEGALHR